MKKEYISPELVALAMEVKPICVVSADGTVTLDRNSEHGVGGGASLGRENDFDED